MPTIRTEGLTKAFRDDMALDELSIELPHGEVLALLGPNGAGKTTTVRLLDGVLEPDAGTSTVLGLDPVRDGDELRRRTGVLTEDAGLDDRLTARENLLFVAAARGLGEWGPSRVDELLEQFGMAERGDTLARGLSTGQRKRVALARSLLHDPELLFVDEPTSGLDPTATREVLALIDSLARDHGRTVVLCTHFLGEAGRLADRMAVLHHGRLQAFGRPNEIADELWTGLDIEVDLGKPAHPGVLAGLTHLDGVIQATATLEGVMVTVDSRDSTPQLVAWLVGRGLEVYGTVPRPPTLEDVYFAIEQRFTRPDAQIPAARPGGPGGETPKRPGPTEMMVGA